MVPAAISGGPSFSRWQPRHSVPGDISTLLELPPIQRRPEAQMSVPTASLSSLQARDSDRYVRAARTLEAATPRLQRSPDNALLSGRREHLVKTTSAGDADDRTGRSDCHV